MPDDLPPYLVPGIYLPPIPDYLLEVGRLPAFKAWLRALELPGRVAAVWLRRRAQFEGLELTAQDYADVGAPKLRGQED